MKKHCCRIMADQVNYTCSQHADPFDCPDHLIHYSKKFDEYSIIIHDEGTSSSMILYCPWCGTRLPESKRDLWFAELEKLGCDDPGSQDIPEKFQTGTWPQCIRKS
jgi:hypothetical protein